ncbi:MAG: SPOR domain-containing protein [Hyphomicrobiales bacterium]
MTIKSITHKVVQVEKRKLENERTSTFSTFALFAFWTLATTGALFVAAISFYTAEPRVELADQPFGIDNVTTAGVSKSSRPESANQQRRNSPLVKRNNQRIDDVTRVISRLRGEQSSLNERIAELDLSVRHLRSENKTLKSQVSDLVNNTQIATAPIIIPANPKNARLPEQTNKLIPRTVDTKRVSNEADVTLNKPLDDIALKDKPADTSSFPKSAASGLENTIDGIKVGSIPIAQTSRFALDLGASSTAARAKNLWNEIGTQKPSVISALTPKFIATGVEDGQTRLIAGPFENAGDAIQACVQLRQVDAFCKTTLFPQ